MAKKRSNNEGTIIKRGNKYRVQLTVGLSRISKTFSTEAEAIAWKSEQLGAIQAGSYIPPQKITLGEWCIQCLETYIKPKVVTRTYDGYLTLLVYISALANHPIQNIKPIDIQHLINNMQSTRNPSRPISPTTKKKLRNLLHLIFNYALFDGIIKANPTFGVTTPKKEKLAPKVFSPEEINKIKHCTDKTNKYYLATMIALYTGMRSSEILGLRWIDLDTRKRTLSVNQTVQHDSQSQLVIGPTKNNSSKRTISVSPALINLIVLQKGNSSQYILATDTGLPVRYSSLKRWFINHLQSVGVTYQGIHTLRHTHATMLVNAGVPITDISARLGHTNISTTLNIYTHANKDDQYIAEKISKIVG